MKKYRKRLLLLFYFLLTFAIITGLGFLTKHPDDKEAAIYGIVLITLFMTVSFKGLVKTTQPALMEYQEHQSKKRMEKLEKAINALADPNLTKEDLANYLEKSQMLLDFAENAEKQHLRMVDRNVKAATGTLMGHSIDLE